MFADVTGASVKAAAIDNSKVDSLFVHMHHADLSPRFHSHVASVSLCSCSLSDLFPFASQSSSLPFNLESGEVSPRHPLLGQGVTGDRALKADMECVG